MVQCYWGSQGSGGECENSVKSIITLFTAFTPGGGWSSQAGIYMVFIPFTLFHHLNLNVGIKGGNSGNPSYLHYLHMGWKISGVNN